MNKKWQVLKNSLQQMAPFFLPYKWGFVIALLMIVVTCFSLSISPMIEGMMTSLLMENAMDMLHHIPGAHVEYDRVMEIIVMLLGIYLLKTVSQSITIVTLTNSIQKMMHDLRNALQEKIRKLPVSYFDQHQYGDVLSRITNDVDTLSNALQQTLTEMMRGILMLMLAIFMMFRIHFLMTCIVLLIIPAALLITRFIVKRSQKKFQAQQDALGNLNGAITEMYGGYREILLFNKQKDAIEKFKSINQTLYHNAFQAQFISMAPNNRRGTANSSYLTSWDLGVGLGVFVGGHIAEVTSYGVAYRWAWVVSMAGLLLFVFVVRKHYEKNRLLTT